MPSCAEPGGGGSYEVTSRTKLKRMPARGAYDKRLVHSILDEALIVHVAYQVLALAHMWTTAPSAVLHAA